MEVDDMLGTIKKLKHPSEVASKTTTDTLKIITDKLGDISTIIATMKK